MTTKKLEHSDLHDEKQVGAESLIGEFKSLIIQVRPLAPFVIKPLKLSQVPKRAFQVSRAR